MIYSYNLVGKQKTETGFSSFLEQPGTTEISFELCTVPDPEYVFEDDIFGDGSWFIGLLIFWGVVVLLVVGVPLVCIIIALVSFIKKRRKRGKSSENEAFHDSTKETEHDETE